MNERITGEAGTCFRCASWADGASSTALRCPVHTIGVVLAASRKRDNRPSKQTATSLVAPLATVYARAAQLEHLSWPNTIIGAAAGGHGDDFAMCVCDLCA